MEIHIEMLLQMAGTAGLGLILIGLIYSVVRWNRRQERLWWQRFVNGKAQRPSRLELILDEVPEWLQLLGGVLFGLVPIAAVLSPWSMVPASMLLVAVALLIVSFVWPYNLR